MKLGLDMKINDINFFTQDAEVLAPKLLGKYLCVKTEKGIERHKITETECYKGSEDSASHAFRGKTNRTKIMWEQGGICYVYLCYGIHNLLNIISGKEGEPQGVLIRGLKDFYGPGKLCKKLQIDCSFNNCSIIGNKIWIEDKGNFSKFVSLPRIGIGYALKKDQEKLWRFRIIEN